MSSLEVRRGPARERRTFCARSIFSVPLSTLSRNLTRAALIEYLESDMKTMALADLVIDDSVDGDLLLGAILLAQSANPTAMASYFDALAPIGAPGCSSCRGR